MRKKHTNNQKVLIIMHGAFGDWLLATALFRAIREHHKHTEIYLLTGSAYLPLAKACPYIDFALIDDRPKIWQPYSFLKVLKTIRSNYFHWVYDLKNTTRTFYYFHLLSGRFQNWNGRVKGCQYRQISYRRKDNYIDNMHDQLKVAGVTELYTNPDLSWLSDDISELALDKPFVLLVPGCSTGHPEKLWTAVGFCHLIERLYNKGISSVGNPPLK
jgi:ADP-heptose:LPS heptosyltransferase